jgi:hypothetical protein
MLERILCTIHDITNDPYATKSGPHANRNSKLKVQQFELNAAALYLKIY